MPLWNLGSGSNPTSVSVQSSCGLIRLRHLEVHRSRSCSDRSDAVSPLLAGLATAKSVNRAPSFRFTPPASAAALLGKAAAWLVGMAEVLLVNLLAWPFFALVCWRPHAPHLGFMLYIACGVFWGFLGSNTKSQSAVIQAVTFRLPAVAADVRLHLPSRQYPHRHTLVANFVPARSYILLTRDAFCGVWAGL